jgi:hypothetical protein
MTGGRKTREAETASNPRALRPDRQETRPMTRPLLAALLAATALAGAATTHGAPGM